MVTDLSWPNNDFLHNISLFLLCVSLWLLSDPVLSFIRPLLHPALRLKHTADKHNASASHFLSTDWNPSISVSHITLSLRVICNCCGLFPVKITLFPACLFFLNRTLLKGYSTDFTHQIQFTHEEYHSSAWRQIYNRKTGLIKRRYQVASWEMQDPVFLEFGTIDLNISASAVLIYPPTLWKWHTKSLDYPFKECNYFSVALCPCCVAPPDGSSQLKIVHFSITH